MIAQMEAMRADEGIGILHDYAADGGGLSRDSGERGEKETNVCAGVNSLSILWLRHNPPLPQAGEVAREA